MFKPESIESPLELSDKNYRDAVKYTDSKHFFYLKYAGGYSSETVYLTDEQFANINQTLFVVNVSSQTVVVPGFGASGLSSVSVTYFRMGNPYTLILDVSDSSKALIFTCSQNSYLIKYVYAYR